MSSNPARRMRRANPLGAKSMQGNGRIHLPGQPPAPNIMVLMNDVQLVAMVAGQCPSSLTPKEAVGWAAEIVAETVVNGLPAPQAHIARLQAARG